MTTDTIYSDELAKGWLPWGAVSPFLCIVFIAGPLLGVSEILEYFNLLDAKGDPIGLVGVFAFLLFPFTAMGMVVFTWVYFVEKRSLGSIGLVWSQKNKPLLFGYVIGFATIFAVVVAIWAVGGFESAGYGHAFNSPMALMNIGGLLIFFSVQSGVEEIVFRGWLLSVVTRKFNIIAAVIIVSIVFTFLHWSPRQDWLTTLNLFLFSIFTCCWVIKAGNIWGVMGWHAGWNWLLAVGFEQPVTGFDIKVPALLVKLNSIGPDYLTGGTEGPEGSVLCNIFFCCAIVFLLWRIRFNRESL